jgi:hypothetical protein
MRAQAWNSGPVRGVDHRQAKHRRAMIQNCLFGACTMPDSEYSRKHDLECLGLASDLKLLANSNVSPILRSQFLRMAKVWTGLAVSRPDANFPIRP